MLRRMKCTVASQYGRKTAARPRASAKPNGKASSSAGSGGARSGTAGVAQALDQLQLATQTDLQQQADDEAHAAAEAAAAARPQKQRQARQWWSACCITSTPSARSPGPRKSAKRRLQSSATSMQTKGRPTRLAQLWAALPTRLAQLWAALPTRLAQLWAALPGTSRSMRRRADELQFTEAQVTATKSADFKQAMRGMNFVLNRIPDISEKYTKMVDLAQASQAVMDAAAGASEAVKGVALKASDNASQVAANRARLDTVESRLTALEGQVAQTAYIAGFARGIALMAAAKADDIVSLVVNPLVDPGVMELNHQPLRGFFNQPVSQLQAHAHDPGQGG